MYHEDASRFQLSESQRLSRDLRRVVLDELERSPPNVADPESIVRSAMRCAAAWSEVVNVGSFLSA